MFVKFIHYGEENWLTVPGLPVLVTRICCSMVMHVQTERYIRFGLNMAKFAINHPNEFESSGAAIVTGLLYAVIMALISLACIIKMCNTD